MACLLRHKFLFSTGDGNLTKIRHTNEPSSTWKTGNYAPGKVPICGIPEGSFRTTFVVQCMTNNCTPFLEEILDSFEKTDFWYIDQRKQSFSDSMKFQRSEDKWWLPEPCVPESGLSDRMHRELQQKRDQASQIHKMAMEINSGILSEMQVPLSYIETLPKVQRNCLIWVFLWSWLLKLSFPPDKCISATQQSGKVGVGDAIYRYMSAGDQFSPDHLLNFLNLSSEHEALEIADRVEAAMYVWRRKASMTHVVSKWENVTELNADGDKNLILASRARSLLLCLKQRFPGLSQTTLDTSKIQYNKVMLIHKKYPNFRLSQSSSVFSLHQIWLMLEAKT